MAVSARRDGVINRKAPEGSYVNSWEELELLPGVIDAVARLNRASFLVFVVSNQRNVAKKQISAAALEDMHVRLRQVFAEHGATIGQIYCCTHDIDEHCNCRKPQPGMLLTAAREHDLNLSESWLVGDSVSDIEAGQRAGCSTAWIADSVANTQPTSRHSCSRSRTKTVSRRARRA